MVEVEERGAEEDQRRDDDACEERGHAERRLALLAQEEDEDSLREQRQDRQGRERAQRVHVVRAAELCPPLEGRLEADPFDDRRRDGEPDEGEPHQRGHDVEDQQERHGNEDHDAGRERDG